MVKKQKKGDEGKTAAASDGKPRHSMDAKRGKAANGMRSAATVKRLQMYKQRPTRDKRGKLLKMDLQSKELPNTRIVPDRRWFQNSRVIGQKELQQFREEVGNKVNDTYSVLLKDKKLPLALLQSERAAGGKEKRVHLLSTEPFAEVFGKGKTRKRPKMLSEAYDGLVQKAEENADEYIDKQLSGIPGKMDNNTKAAIDHRFLLGERNLARDKLMMKGQSRRIWGELYKVIDSSDVVVQVIDARDPMGTRCWHMEAHLRKNARQKHMLIVLNKCDLVPAWVTKRWLYHLSREYPTIAFHASLTNSFGKGAVLSVLRQIARLRGDKQGTSVGFVGYPNVGKSSVINTLRSKKLFLLSVASFWRTWRDDFFTPGVVRVSKLEDAEDHITEVLKRVKPEYITRAYKVKEWSSTVDFLEQVARKNGKLGKGGEPDCDTASKMVLYDWQRGRIPFFVPPPELPEGAEEAVPEMAKAQQVDSKTGEVSKENNLLLTAAAAIMREQQQRRAPVVRNFYTEEDNPHDEEEEEEAAEDEDEGSEGDDEDDKDDDEAEDDGEDDDDVDDAKDEEEVAGEEDGDGSEEEDDGDDEEAKKTAQLGK
eukprot:gene21368-25686_t